MPTTSTHGKFWRKNQKPGPRRNYPVFTKRLCTAQPELSYILRANYVLCRKQTHMEFMLNGNGDGSGDLKKVDFEALERCALEGNV